MLFFCFTGFDFNSFLRGHVLGSIHQATPVWSFFVVNINRNLCITRLAFKRREQYLIKYQIKHNTNTTAILLINVS